VGVIKATFITKATVSRCFDFTEPPRLKTIINLSVQTVPTYWA